MWLLDEGTSQWVILSREEFTYNARGNLTQSITSFHFYDSFKEKDEFKYDIHGKMIEVLGYDWNETSGTWDLSDKDEFVYDPNGYLIQKLENGWEESDEKWIPYRKEEYKYDDNGNMIESVESFSPGTQQWVTQYKHDYTYDANGNQLQTSGFRWDEGTSKWVPIDRLNYIYDDVEHITNSLYYSWDESSSKFVDSWDEEYTYDEHGNIVQNIQHEWDGDTRETIGKGEFTYDNSCTRSDLILPCFADEISIVEAIDVLALFKHKMVSFLRSFWDESSNNWVGMVKGDYFYSEQNISSSKEMGKEVSRIYPNPALTQITIETIKADLYNIEITSLNGQQLLNVEMEGITQQIDISSFQSGVYFITIRSKDFVTTRKIIKL